MSLLSLLVFGCFLGSRKATSLKTTGAMSSHRYWDGAARGLGGQRWPLQPLSNAKQIILLELRLFITLLLKCKVDLF